MSFVCIGTGGEEMEKRLGRDGLLTNLMIYWVTETTPSPLRGYYENAHANPPAPAAYAGDLRGFRREIGSGA
ncbi:MAG: hypothetical protein ABI036_19260 [Fibrobacteria bacterium]